MYLDRLKLVTKERAARLVGVDSAQITRAVETYRLSKGARGLAFVIPPGKHRPLIRLCAIDAWLSQQEEMSRYA